ncbi:MAG TPA: hypothetical protein VFB67_02435 [Candidatus Polarisedimenticolaceae bacterium]|nr:hypothetical protein [Candidatus Polarisedimenticolaceae bacterium]
MPPARTARRLLALAAVLAAAGTADARYEGSLNLFVGQKWMQNSDWAPVEEQRDLGLMLDFAEERIPVHFSLDLFYSHDDEPTAGVAAGTPVEAESIEFAIGFRKVWGRRMFRPHLGAGGTAIQAEIVTALAGGTDKRSDRGYGVWIDGGLSWRLVDHLNVGLEVRYSKATVDLNSGFEILEAAAGGLHVGALIGYGW